jgi:hypothetical protein
MMLYSLMFAFWFRVFYPNAATITDRTDQSEDAMRK